MILIIAEIVMVPGNQPSYPYALHDPDCSSEATANSGLLSWGHTNRAIQPDGLAVQHRVFDDGLGQLSVFVRATQA